MHGTGEQWFEVIAAGDVVPAKKPAPDIYTWAMQRLGLGPDVCVALEDSDNGVRSALEAGIRSVVVTVNDYTKNHNFQGAALVVDQFGEPGAPGRVLHGLCESAVVVDLPLLRRIHDLTHH